MNTPIVIVIPSGQIVPYTNTLPIPPIPPAPPNPTKCVSKHENKYKRNEFKTAEYVPCYLGTLSSLKDLISLAKGNQYYSNIDVSKLKAIKYELMDLDEMIGLHSIKKSIFEQLLFYLQNFHHGSSMYLNTVIYGPPGVGKTTVSKIIGKMFSKLGILSRDRIFDKVRRSDLVGEYLGQTAIKTRECLKDCLGGVMFIDEIYSLGNAEKRDSFSKEAIDTINQFLSENRDDFMMIVAGYKEEVEKCFFSYNEGLRRRFMWYHTIEPYGSEELKDIFLDKVKYDGNGWKIEMDNLSEWFSKNYDKFSDNGGSIENFLNAVKIKHSCRVILLPKEQKKIIKQEDLEEALKNFKKEEKDNHLSMYL